MKILNSVFLWFTVSCYFVENVCSTTSHFQEDLIDEAVNAISSISSGTADVLMSLKNIGLKTGLFMKVIVPVGSLIISEINPDAKSEVYKELMKLKEKTDAIWMSNQKAINTTAKELGAKIVEENYINKVIYSAKLLKLFTDKFADPSKYKNEEFISNFKSSCVFGEKSPEGILKYLHLRLVEFCNSTLIPIEVQEYVKNREDLLSIILQFKVAGNEKLPDIEHYLQEYLDIYQRIDDKNILVFEKIEAFNFTYPSYNAALKSYFYEIKKKASIAAVNYKTSDKCFLRSLIEGANFNYPLVESFVFELKEIFIDIGYIGGICANISYNGRSHDMDEYLKTISDQILIISNHTVNWLTTSLESSWPSVHQEVLKEQLIRIIPNPGQVTIDNLSVVLDLTLKQIYFIGTKNYAYQCLISKMEGQELFYFGLLNFCSVKKDIFGFITVISRIPVNFKDVNDREQANIRLDGLEVYGSSLNNTIQKEMPLIYNADSIEFIATTLEEKMGNSFISDDNFHCWTIIRLFGTYPWSLCPTIVYTAVYYGYGEIHGMETYRYYTDGTPLQDCEKFVFIFFK